MFRQLVLKAGMFVFMRLYAVSCLYAATETTVVTPPPVWSVPKLAQAPVIDGRINDGAWKHSACITGYQLFPEFGRGFCPLQTWAFLGWDQTNLYLAFRAPHTYRDIILVNVRGRDAAAFTDEAFEVHLWSENSDQPYSFIIGLASLYDARFGDASWNAAGIQYEISQHDGLFEAEMAIPWKDMDISPRAGMELKAVMGHDSLENGRQMSNWHYSSFRYGDRNLAGSLVFTENTPSVRMLDWGQVDRGYARPVLELVNFGSESSKLEYKLFAGTGIDQPDDRYLLSGTVDLSEGETRRIEPNWPVLNTELGVARLLVVQDATKLADFAFPFKFTPEIRATVQCFPSKQMLMVSVDAESVLAIGQVDSIAVSLCDVNGVISKQVKPAGKTAKVDIEFDFSKLEIGNYIICIECIGNDGVVLKSTNKSWCKIDARPDWMVHPVAAERRVPKPFMPVCVNTPAKGQIDVSMWGRMYSFNDSLYPTQIRSQKQNFLATPIRLTGTMDGKMFDVNSAKVKVLEKAADRTVLSTEGTTGGLSIHTQTTIEFDGMFLSTLTLTPKKHESAIESLKLEIPFDSKMATLMHRNNCTPSAPGWSGQTPTNWSGTFHPVVWLGNETAGLCWFAESANGWNNVSADSQLKISTADGCTVFTLNFIDKPVKINKPLSITFGFTATPTKPMPDGWLMDKNITFDPWWDESNQFLHEAIPWEKWHEQLDKIHRAGGKMLKYTQTNFLSFYGDLTTEEMIAQKRPGSHYFDTPEKKFWQAEWEIWPRTGMGGKANNFCSMTAWKDLVVAGLKERMVKGRVDGIYFDCSAPRPCNSKIHGCKGGYDILGQRDIRRRLYNIFDELGKDGIVVEHISDNMLGPVMNFATYHYDGEQFSNGVKDYRDKLSLGRLRAFSIGTNWGHIPKFMAFAYGDDVSTQSLMALWTLHMPWHDVHGWVSSVGEAARKLDKDFGFTRDTKRLGYWENSDIIGGQNDTLKSTIYYKHGSIFIVVSNLGDTAIEPALSLNIAKLGFDVSKLKVSGYVENQSAKPTLSGDKLNLTIKANSCVMCILEAV